MQLKPALVTPPVVTPVSAEEAKAHLRVSHSDEDAVIGAHLSAAVARLDGHAGILGRCMITQTWRQDYDCWPLKGLFRLPFCDVREITSLKYSDADDVEQTVDPGLYQLHQDGLSSFVWLRSAFTSPSLFDDRLDPVRITFKAGYGDAAEAVPADIRHAIKLMVGDLYENREDTVVGVGVDVRPLPRGVDALLSPHRRVGL